MVQVSPIWFHLEPECALEGPGRPIRVPGEFQEVTVSAMPPNQLQPLVTPLLAPRPRALRPSPARSSPAPRKPTNHPPESKHKKSQYGHSCFRKSSRERMCPRGLSGGVRGARWTQIGTIARANMPCSPVKWRLPCQVKCRKRGTVH